MLMGYKTYIAALLVAISGVLAQTNWVEFLNNPTAGLVAIGSAILFAVLRALTTTAGALQIVINDPKKEETENK